MDPELRATFNAAFNPGLYERMLEALSQRLGSIPFRVAESPLFLTPELRDALVRNAGEIMALASEPGLLARFRQAVPTRYDVPRMDALPNTAQVDFALVEGQDGKLQGKLIEMQGFPSVFSLMIAKSEAWATAMNEVPPLQGAWTCLLGPSREEAIELIRRTLLGGCLPEEVVLVDLDPEHQKTVPDFVATHQLFGIDAVDLLQLRIEGRKVLREKDGRWLPVKRIYNRVVFDELEAKGVQAPFKWTDDLDVAWCSHPNWFWVWSKVCLPYLKHPWVPASVFLSELHEIPEDLSRYVLKPLFSFAGTGVVIDVTRAAIEAVPPDQRGEWVLQEKIEYAPALRMPTGEGVKAEVRVMAVRPPDAEVLTPVLFLVRLSRGKMHGVDHNKDFTWVGSSVGMWREQS